MSKYDEYLVPAIAELLEELCPEGVEVVPITNTVDFIRGLTYTKAEENLLGDVTVLRANNISLQTSRLDFADLKRITRKNKPIRPDLFLKANDILMATNSGSKQHAGKTTFITDDMPNVAFGGFMAVLRTKPGVNARYIYQLLSSRAFSEYKNQVLQSSTINNIKQSTLEGFEIPLPPLEVQEQIVTILDTFTDLNASLNQELELREAQFAHYRDLLLDFKEGQSDPHNSTYPVPAITELLKKLCPEGVPTISVQGACLVESSKGLKRSEILQSGTYPVIDQGEEYVSGYTDDSAYVIADVPVIVFGDHSRRIKWIDAPFAPGADGTKVLRPDTTLIQARYFYHALTSVDIPDLGYSRHWSKVKALAIPLPPLSIQERIIAILDMFSDYTHILRREINLRRQQLEYYREKLLTFPVAE